MQKLFLFKQIKSREFSSSTEDLFAKACFPSNDWIGGRAVNGQIWAREREKSKSINRDSVFTGLSKVERFTARVDVCLWVLSLRLSSPLDRNERRIQVSGIATDEG